MILIMIVQRMLLTSLLGILALVGQAQRFNIGVNIGKTAPWGEPPLFANVMKQSSNWLVQDVQGNQWNIDSLGGTAVQIPSLVNGYPNQVPFSINGQALKVHTFFLNSQPAPWYYPAGDYTLVLQGTGTVSLEWDYFGQFTAPGTYTIHIANPTEAGIHLIIDSSSTTDPIHNIEFLLPHHGPNSNRTFNQAAVDKMQPWNVIRFLKATNIEENPVVDWADRPLPDYYNYFDDGEEINNSQILRGMPWEVMIQLCNEHQIHPWICLPYKVNDHYVTELATLLRDSLDPNLRAYIEYSNETWNSFYGNTHQHVNTQGTALGYSLDPFQAGIYYTVRRSIEVYEIFENVYGNTLPQRVTKVLAGAGFDWYMLNMYNALHDSLVNPKGTMPDAWATAPYVGGEIIDHMLNPNNPISSQLCSVTTQDILDSLYDNMPPIMLESMVPARHYADLLGIQLFTYESGQHLVPAGFQGISDSCLNQTVAQTNRSVGMEQFYCDYISYLRDTFQVDLNVAFILTRPYESETFGILESTWQDVQTSPKWRAYEQCGPLQNPLNQSPIRQAPYMGIKVYPNPVLHALNIEFEAAIPTVQLELIHSNGQLIYTTQLQEPSLHTLDMQPYPAGVFWLKVSNKASNFLSTQKIIHLK